MIDELGLWRVVNKCAHLKFKFERVYCADNFPVTLRENTFVIVNSDISEKDGTHWLLYCNRQNEYCFSDPLGLPLQSYKNISCRVLSTDFGIKEIINYQLQKPTSNFCGLYCIYIAHYVFSAYYPLIPMISEDELLRFVKHILYFCWHYF